MDVRFIARASAFLSPFVLLFAVARHFYQPANDYFFHLGYLGGGGYPSGLAYLLNALSWFMPRELAFFLLTVAVVLYLPYVLVFEITREEKAAWLYLYGSGIPLILFYISIIPQAIIHVFILASLRWKWGIVAFLLFGWLFHYAWLFAFVLVVAYRFLSGKYAR